MMLLLCIVHVVWFIPYATGVFLYPCTFMLPSSGC